MCTGEQERVAELRLPAKLEMMLVDTWLFYPFNLLSSKNIATAHALSWSWTGILEDSYLTTPTKS